MTSILQFLQSDPEEPVTERQFETFCREKSIYPDECDDFVEWLYGDPTDYTWSQLEEKFAKYKATWGVG